jgi:chromosome partitioning protein
MRILALVNQKGGCGKTTLAVHLASRFADRRLRTLLVDLDPQGHATLGLGAGAPAKGRGVADVLEYSGLEEAARPLRAIAVPVFDHLDLAPTGPELSRLEPDLARTPGGEERLAEHLAPLVSEYDRVVVDAPPALGLLTINTLMAAGDVVVPVEPSLYSLHGLARIVELKTLLCDRSQHPSQLHIVLNAFDGRTRFARKTRDEIAENFPERLLGTTVRPSVRIREAAARGVPVDRLHPREPVSEDLESLAAEIESRVAAQERPAARSGLVVASEGLYLTRHDMDPDRVRLAGTFNDWQPDAGVLLERHDDGSWTKFVPLPPGRYEYKLVVDGRWVSDPLNPEAVPNDAGSTNSVVEIRP